MDAQALGEFVGRGPLLRARRARRQVLGVGDVVVVGGDAVV
ncbi:MAG: hypothetical protein JWN62_2127, partial [Acidimicrobiales bacterium]|nr:hypothetical protein [Acidimicrobiales bacterium]